MDNGKQLALVMSLIAVITTAASLSNNNNNNALAQFSATTTPPETTTTTAPPPAATTTTPAGFTQFSNAFFGLTVSYPATWEVRDPYTGPITGETSILQIFAPGDGPMDASRANVNFEIAPEYIPGMLIKDVQDRYMTRVYGAMPNVQILNSSVITLSGGNVQAYMLEYSFDSLDGDNMTHVKIMTSPPQLQKTYEITFSTPTEQYAALKPVFQQILSTVQFG